MLFWTTFVHAKMSRVLKVNDENIVCYENATVDNYELHEGQLSISNFSDNKYFEKEWIDYKMGK